MLHFEPKQLGVLEERRIEATAAGTATASRKVCRFSVGDRQFEVENMVRIHKNPLDVGGALFSILFVKTHVAHHTSRCRTLLKICRCWEQNLLGTFQVEPSAPRSS